MGKKETNSLNVLDNMQFFYRYVPYPGGGEKWGGNGVGDDLYSFGFDGGFLWCGGRKTQVISDPVEPFIRKGICNNISLLIVTY